MGDDDARFGLVWVGDEAAGEREVAAEDEGKGELELWEDGGMEMLASRLCESVEEESLGGVDH